MALGDQIDISGFKDPIAGLTSGLATGIQLSQSQQKLTLQKDQLRQEKAKQEKDDDFAMMEILEDRMESNAFTDDQKVEFGVKLTELSQKYFGGEINREAITRNLFGDEEFDGFIERSKGRRKLAKDGKISKEDFRFNQHVDFATTGNRFRRNEARAESFQKGVIKDISADLERTGGGKVGAKEATIQKWLKGDRLSPQEELIIEKEFPDPFQQRAAQIVMSDPSMFAKSTEEKLALVNETAVTLRETSRPIPGTSKEESSKRLKTMVNIGRKISLSIRNLTPQERAAVANDITSAIELVLTGQQNDDAILNDLIQAYQGRPEIQQGIQRGLQAILNASGKPSQ